MPSTWNIRFHGYICFGHLNFGHSIVFRIFLRDNRKIRNKHAISKLNGYRGLSKIAQFQIALFIWIHPAFRPRWQFNRIGSVAGISHPLCRRPWDYPATQKNLTLIGPISDMLFDQAIGAGCVRQIRAAWVGNVIMGSSYNFRRRIEPDTGEMVLVSVHPGVKVDAVVENTAWPLRVAKGLFRTPAPTGTELAILSCLGPQGYWTGEWILMYC